MILPLASYNLAIIAAAVIPAIYLMIKVYRSDKLEPESPRLLVSLVIAGIFSALLALVSEIVLEYALNMFFQKDTLIYNLIMYYFVVAVSEEGAKYLMLKRRTWKHPEFDCRFDGIVYAAFVSLGFALWENISYVYSYGFGTALVRAVTAIPGHASFGVFMGIYYAAAKEYDIMGDRSKSSSMRKLALLIPVFFHGTYDFLATNSSTASTIAFFAFVLVMFFIANKVVNKMSKEDHYMSWRVL